MSAAQTETPGGGPAYLTQSQLSDEIIGADPEHLKRFQNLRALLCLRGYELYLLTTGGFLIARHDKTAHAPDLRGVQAFFEAVR